MGPNNSNKSASGKNGGKSTGLTEEAHVPLKRSAASPKKKFPGLGGNMTNFGKKKAAVMAVRKPKLIFGQRFTGGVAAVYVTESHDYSRQAYIHPIVRLLGNDEERMESLFVHGIFNRRHPAIADNEMMGPDANRPGTPGYFKTFVRIYTDETENDESHLLEWMGIIECAFNDIARDPNIYQYPCEFKVAIDLTDKLILEPPSHLLVNDDVMKILDMSYPTDSTPRADQAKFVSKTYFGEWNGAKNFIETYPVIKN